MYLLIAVFIGFGTNGLGSVYANTMTIDKTQFSFESDCTAALEALEKKFPPGNSNKVVQMRGVCVHQRIKGVYQMLHRIHVKDGDAIHIFAGQTLILDKRIADGQLVDPPAPAITGVVNAIDRDDSFGGAKTLNGRKAIPE